MTMVSGITRCLSLADNRASLKNFGGCRSYTFLKMQQLNKVSTLETVAFVRDKRTPWYVATRKLDIFRNSIMLADEKCKIKAVQMAQAFILDFL